MKKLETLFRFIWKTQTPIPVPKTHFQTSDLIAVQVLLTTTGSSKPPNQVPTQHWFIQELTLMHLDVIYRGVPVLFLNLNHTS
jgi:hypothetical protein